MILDRMVLLTKILDLYLIDKFKWVDGSLNLIKYLNKKKQNIFVVTNQSGITRGYFSEKKLNLLHQYIKNFFKKKTVI